MYVKLWKEEGGFCFFTFLSRSACLLSFPSDLSKWVFLEQTEMVFDKTKTISQWNQCSEHNGIAPIGKKCIENIEPETLSNFHQYRFQILIKTESGSS